MNKFRRTLGATSLIHDKVVNLASQDIGPFEELMVDVTTGRVAYAVLSFGGFMGIGKTRTFHKRDQIAAELAYFARCIREDVDPEPSGWEGRADVRILQAIQASARFGRAVPIDPIARPHRPDLAQEIRMPAHELPQLVDVEQAAK